MVLTMVSVSHAEDKETHPVYGQKMKALDGKDVDLSKYQGKVLLIVNTASECGATPQYAALQALHEKYKEKGLIVAGFPCNQFGQQEPGSADEIQQFCQKNYGVKFDLFAKIDVNGPNAAPLFKFLTSEKVGLKDQGKVQWNFEKFLVDRQGKVIARFRTPVEPDSPEVVKAIEAALN
jgi:glutathione peroxidase